MTLAVMLLAMLPSEPAEATARIELVWEAPVECPSAEAMREDIAALVRHESVRGPVHAEGRIIAIDGGYALEIAVQGPQDTSTRRVEGSDCVPLARAAALVVAVAADPMSPSDPDGGEQAPPLPPVAREPPPIEPVQREPESATTPMLRAGHERRHRVGLSAHAGAAIGLAPATTGGIEAEVAWLYGRLRVAAIGSHWFARDRELLDGAGVHAGVSGGGLRACFAPRGGPLEFPLCTGIEASVVVARGTGEPVIEHRRSDWMLGLPLSVGLDAPIGRRFVLRTRIESLIQLRRPAFHLQTGGQPAASFRPWIVGLRIVIGAGVRLP